MRITRGDGLIDRDQAAELCGVTPDAVTIWATRGYWTRDRQDALRAARGEAGGPQAAV